MLQEIKFNQFSIPSTAFQKVCSHVVPGNFPILSVPPFLHLQDVDNSDTYTS